MYRPPSDPRDDPIVDHPTWRSVLASYVGIAVFLLLLWTVSHPLAGTVVLATVAGLGIGGRRVLRLVRCFYDCGGFALDLGGRVRITVARTGADDPCR